MACDQLEGFDGLPKCHATSIRNAHAGMPGFLHQQSVLRKIDNIRDPGLRVIPRWIDRSTGMVSHTHGRAVDDTLNTFGRKREINQFQPGLRPDSPYIRDQGLGAQCAQVRNGDPRDAAIHQSKNNGQPGTAGTHDMNELSFYRSDMVHQRLFEAKVVGIPANRLPIPEHDRVHSLDFSGDAFEPAFQLYLKFGFVECGPFADYTHDPFSRFMTLSLND